MSKFDQELYKLSDQFQKRVGIRTFRATLGDISGRVDEPGQDGYVRVRIQTASGLSDYITVRNLAAVNKIPGTAVIVGYDPDSGELAVLRNDFTGLLAQGTNPTSSNPADPNNSYFIQQMRLVTFACHPVSSAANSMLVAVQSGTVLDLDANTITLFAGAQVDLTSFIPASTGEWCIACLFWKSDNTIETFASTAKTSPTDLGIDDINECLAARTAGSLPIWAWQLYNGQTGIAAGAPVSGGDDFMDLRPLWFMLGGGGGGAPTDAKYWVSEANASLSAEVNLGALTTGLLKHTVAAGVSTPATATAGTDYLDPSNANITNYIDYAEASTPSTPASNHARIWAADDNGFTVERWIESGGVIFQEGQDLFVVAKNTGATITKQSCVRLIQTAGGLRMLKSSANATQIELTDGVVMEDTGTNAFGRVLLQGMLDNTDTSGFSAGAVLWTSTTAGVLASSAPAAGAGWAQRVGVVITSHATNGKIFVLVQPAQQDQIFAAAVGLGTGSAGQIDLYGTATRKGTLIFAPLGADQVATFIDATGNVVLDSATQTLTNKSIVATQINSGTLDEARLPHKFAIIEDQQAQNTAGGGSTATTWTTRVLNTEVVDADSIVSISSNQFTPIAGTYRITVNSPFFGNATTASNGRIRLYNATGTTVIFTGNNHVVPISGGVNMTFTTEFTANGTDAYAVQYYITLARATNGLGVAINEASAVEHYTQVLLEKIA